MSRPRLTPEQQAESDHLFAALKQSAEEDLRALADLLAAKPDGQLLGAAAFEVRDRAHRIGAKAIATALAGRKKGGTTAPPAPARTAARPPSSSAGRPGRS